MTFAYWITWTSSRWNDVWGWVKNCVNRNEFISSDQRYSFQKNLDIPLYSAPTGYIRRKIIQNGALLVTIQILATFWDQNFQVFIWRDLEGNILGKRLLGLLNIVPARDLAISSYFSCSENWFLCEFAKWYFAILELWLPGFSVIGDIVNVAWPKLIRYTCYLCFLPEISCFLYLFYTFKLTEFQRLSRWRDRTSWIRHGTYVINQFTFCWKNLCCWAVYLLIRD